MNPVFSESDDQQLFEELRKLISELGGLGKKYPALYRLYLKVATPERMDKEASP